MIENDPKKTLMIEDNEVYWVCTDCDTHNIDLYGETAYPICENCGEGWDWEVLLTDEEEDRIRSGFMR